MKRKDRIARWAALASFVVGIMIIAAILVAGSARSGSNGVTCVESATVPSTPTHGIGSALVCVSR